MRTMHDLFYQAVAYGILMGICSEISVILHSHIFSELIHLQWGSEKKSQHIVGFTVGLAKYKPYDKKKKKSSFNFATVIWP